MEKCNCKLCEQREFFTGFDKHGKYTGETETRTVKSVYEELISLYGHVGSLGGNNSETLRRISDINDRVDQLDTKLLDLSSKITSYNNGGNYILVEIDDIRKELY